MILLFLVSILTIFTISMRPYTDIRTWSTGKIEIIKEIEAGTKKTKGNYECIVDRKDAMKKAISMEGKNDIVIIAGKGHEMYQEINKEKLPFDEREVIKEIIEEISKEPKKKKK